MHFYAEARTAYAEDLHWELSLGDFPQQDQKVRNRIVQRVNSQMPIFGKRKTPMDFGDRDEKIRIIGAQLDSRTASSWKERNTEWLDWLESQGVSQVEAIREYQDWKTRTGNGERVRKAVKETIVWKRGAA